MMKIKIILSLLPAVLIGWFVWQHWHQAKKDISNSLSQTKSAINQATNTVKPGPPVNHCQINKTGQLVLVDISRQHFWACLNAQTVYDAPVITGKLQNGDSTPLGSYQIYAKQTNQQLKGCEPGNCWNDHVDYWLPYQQASGGTIGFHDATWRKASEFGATAPASNKGSHGCVELTLAAAKWLYGWSTIGTKVKIVS